MTEIVSGNARFMDRGEGKDRLIERDMTRDADTAGREIEATKPFVIRRIANENTRSGSRGEFVRSRGGRVGKA